MSTASGQPTGDRFTIGSTAVAAVLLGGAAVLVSTWLTSDFLRLLVGLVVASYGVVIWRGAAVPDLERPRPLGVPVERALGAVATVLGADLVAAAVDAAIVDAASEEFTPPSPTLLVVIRFGLPLVVLAALAFGGLAAGSVGAGLVLPVAVATVLAARTPDARTLAVVMLVVAALTALLALAPGNPHRARFATIAAAIAASYAVGSGISPMTALDVVTGQPGTSTPGVPAVLPALGLAVTAVVLALAVHRRDAAGGLVATLAFAATPPAFHGPQPEPGTLVLLIVPVVAAAIAVVARATGRWPAPVAAALGGVAALVFAVQALPALGWPVRVEPVVALVVFAAVGVLAWRLPELPGAVLTGAVLVAIARESPWYQMVSGDQPSPAGYAVAGVLDLLATGAALWLLVRRRPTPGVVAAATYCAASTLAHALYGFTVVAVFDGYGWVVLIEFGPVVLLGAVAVVLAARERFLVLAQTVGTVALAVGGFAMVVLIALVTGISVSPAQFGVEVVLRPLAPTSIPYPRVMGAGAGLSVAGVLLVLALAAALAVTLARRASAPLAAAVALVTVAGAHAVAALAVANDLGLGLLAAITLGCGAGCTAIAVGAGRRFRNRPAEPTAPGVRRPGRAHPQ